MQPLNFELVRVRTAQALVIQAHSVAAPRVNDLKARENIMENTYFAAVLQALESSSKA